MHASKIRDEIKKRIKATLGDLHPDKIEYQEAMSKEFKEEIRRAIMPRNYIETRDEPTTEPPTCRPQARSYSDLSPQFACPEGKIRIMSDGTPFGTRVIDSSGNTLTDITNIEIFKINATDDAISARITFSEVELDIIIDRDNITPFNKDTQSEDYLSRRIRKVARNGSSRYQGD